VVYAGESTASTTMAGSTVSTRSHARCCHSAQLGEWTGALTRNGQPDRVHWTVP